MGLYVWVFSYAVCGGGASVPMHMRTMQVETRYVAKAWSWSMYLLTEKPNVLGPRVYMRPRVVLLLWGVAPGHFSSVKFVFCPGRPGTSTLYRRDYTRCL